MQLIALVVVAAFSAIEMASSIEIKFYYSSNYTSSSSAYSLLAGGSVPFPFVQVRAPTLGRPRNAFYNGIVLKANYYYLIKRFIVH